MYKYIKKNMESAQTTKSWCTGTYDLVVLLLGVYPSEVKFAHEKVTCNPLFIAAESFFFLFLNNNLT